MIWRFSHTRYVRKLVPWFQEKKHSSRCNKQETTFIIDVFGISLGLISVQADDSTWLRILWAAVQTAMQTAVHDLQMQQHAMT